MSDISGAFDKVFSNFLSAKLRQFGLGDNYIAFFEAYLQPREAHVAVGGQVSDTFAISDMVYQGTVLGPHLWNLFFADIALPASAHGEREMLFADDLNIFNFFPKHCPDEDVVHALERTRRNVHHWGVLNRDDFDANK